MKKSNCQLSTFNYQLNFGGPDYGKSKIETFCTARHGERPRLGTKH